MQRRKSLKSMALLAGATLVFPTWAKAWSLDNLPKVASPLPPSVADTLALVIYAILPESSTKGAVALGIPAFVQTMLADCYEKKMQDKVQKNLLKLDALAQSQHQQGFSTLSLAQKQTFLLRIEKGEDPDLIEVYGLLKNLSIQGYTSSEYVLRYYLRYDMAPGHYYGCVPVKS
jgi:hypothetical protein